MEAWTRYLKPRLAITLVLLNYHDLSGDEAFLRALLIRTGLWPDLGLHNCRRPFDDSRAILKRATYRYEGSVRILVTELSSRVTCRQNCYDYINEKCIRQYGS